MFELAPACATVPHVAPVPLVYCKALELVLQLGIVNAVGAADEAEKFATTVLAEIEDKPERGSPVPLVSVIADGVPRFGVVSDGEADNTIPPEPVTGWPSAVPTPVPSPEMPPIGSPDAFVSVTDAGVFRTEPDATVAVPLTVRLFVVNV